MFIQRLKNNILLPIIVFPFIANAQPQTHYDYIVIGAGRRCLLRVSRLPDNYDYIVIGAGPGGVTLASLLANDNKRVLLIDKNAQVGGRMSTISKDGFHYEAFPFNGVPQHNSRFEELSARIGKADKVTPIYADNFPQGMGKLYYIDENGTIRSWKMKSNFTNQFKLFKTLGVKGLKQYSQTFKVLGKLAKLKPADIEKLYDISAYDYVESLGEMPKGIKTFILATYSEGAFETSSYQIPAGDMVKMFQVAMKQSGGRYYEGGVGHFFTVMSEKVTDMGGTVLLNSRVKKIIVENGEAKGIVIDDGTEYYAPKIISSAGLRQTLLHLVGAEYFDTAFVERIKSYKPNLGFVGFRYFTNKIVLETPMNIIYPEGCVTEYEYFEKINAGKIKPDRNYLYLGTTSFYKDCAPEGKQLIYDMVSCPADTNIDPSPYLEYIEEITKRICPQLYDEGVIYRTEIVTPKDVPFFGNDVILPGQGGECFGIGNIIGQTGNTRPNATTPIKNLYIVGNDAAGFGLGTHQAVDSGFNVYELVK
ncbi:MAG: NAD(P)/FAD-dependent oxidoreductase [Bacteroidales bacterium]|jgi:prolycopene isomerase|nr:NAD(P)/FAD-dependent oxidoreductase [Bacteroidales bacterium]